MWTCLPSTTILQRRASRRGSAVATNGPTHCATDTCPADASPTFPELIPREPPPRQTSTLAIVSLVTGILGWTLLPWLGSLIAIVTGHLARGEIRRAPDRLEGDGLAVAGLVLGYAMLALTVLGLLVVVLFFGGLVWLGFNS